MSNLADSLAIKRAIEQVVDERIAKITDVCFRVYKALVISVNGDKMIVAPTRRCVLMIDNP